MSLARLSPSERLAAIARILDRVRRRATVCNTQITTLSAEMTEREERALLRLAGPVGAKRRKSR